MDPVEELARNISKEFRRKPESQRIASEFALVELAKFVSLTKPSRVLEIGAGIGTITKLLLTHPNRPRKLTVSESHPTCLVELSKNLQDVSLDGYRLIQRSNELGPEDEFDLVIFDGTLDKKMQYKLFRDGTYFFVEGGRNRTIDELQVELARKGLFAKVERRLPGRNEFRFFSKRQLFGIPLPFPKFRPMKGCSIGYITAQ